MNIKLLTGEDETFIERLEYIMYMYDVITVSNTKLNRKIKEMCIIFCENDSCGLLLDYHPRENYGFYRLMFAAFEKNNRRKGYLRACLEFAKNNNISIPIVEFDSPNQIELWGKLGYADPTIEGWLQIMSNVDLKTLEA